MPQRTILIPHISSPPPHEYSIFRPLGNILNINLPSNTGWESGYKDALLNEAIPFLVESKPDILLVAAGFDALDADLTSKLKLEPQDFCSIATILKEKFGNRIAFGLEGKSFPRRNV